MFTVGPVAGELLPGAPRRRRRGAARRSRRRGRAPARRRWSELGVELEAILLTHTHFDHIGAVAPIARATGAPVYCPRARADVLARPDELRSRRCSAPFEGWDAEHTVDGGERLQLAGLRHRRPLHARPQPRPRHLRDRRRRCSPATCSSRARSAAPTCPGGDHATLAGLDRRPARALRRRHQGPSRAHGPHDARPRARDQPLPAGARGAGEREAPGAARHVRRAARPGRRARGARGRRARGSSSRPATGASRRRPSRPPSSSPAASASRPTSSRRRCTPSRTPAGAR